MSRPEPFKAYVSAGSRGLALAAALSLARAGAQIAISSRDGRRLSEAKDQILAEVPNASVLTVVADLSSVDDQEHVLTVLEDEAFSPDVFVCSAGHAARKRLEDILRSEYEAGIEMILNQAVFATQRFLPAMATRGWGRIIYVSSIHAKYPNALPPEFILSSIARCGLLSLTKAIQSEYASAGIAAFSVALGYIDTPMLRNAAIGRDVDANELESNGERPWLPRYAEWSRSIPAGRIAAASEFGDLVGFLASDAADYLNGQLFNFSGGLDGGIV